MKKLLLGTSALIGATALVASASAAAPELTISGNLDFRLVGGEVPAYDLDNNSGNESTDVGTGAIGYDFSRSNSRSEIRFRAAGESDGGLVYGANIDYRYAANVTDEAYIYVGGDWGRVHLGDDDGAIDARTVNAGSIAPGAYLIDNGTTFIDQESNSDVDGTKISYFSPDYQGFQFAVSVYESTGSTFDSNGSATDASGQTNPALFTEVNELAVSYSGEYGSVGYTVSAGAQAGSISDAVTENTGLVAGANTAYVVTAGATSTAQFDDLSELVVGVKIDYDRFNFVASYNDAGDSGTLQRIGGAVLAIANTAVLDGALTEGREYYSFGVAYDVGGGMAVGFSYGEATHSVARTTLAAAGGAISAVRSQEITNTLYTIDFGFPIMEGMAGYAGVAFSEWEEAALAATTAAGPSAVTGLTNDAVTLGIEALSREATTYVIGTTVSF